MLSKLIIEGFQKWKKLILELGQITVLVGDNEVGKSAVVRALQWLCLNTWEGKAGEFINWDMESCQVKLEVDSNLVIRFKDKNSNLYILNGEEYKAFGTKVPQPIAKTLNLTPDNFQSQLDLPFWLTLNNSQAASALNEIFDLSIIDTTVSNVSREVRESKMRVSISKERLEYAVKTKKELDWIVEANQDLKAIESLFTQIQELHRELGELEALFYQVEEYEWLEEEILDEIKDLQNLISLGQMLITIEEENNETEEMIFLHYEIIKTKKTLESNTKTLNKYLSGQCPLCGRS